MQDDSWTEDGNVSATEDTNELRFFRLLQLILAGVYVFLTLSIVCHCIVAISMIWLMGKEKNAGTVHHFVYVLTLVIVDVVVLSHLPFLVIEMIETSWVFGITWCRFFWVAENVNKIVSSFILTALCFDRYLMVCRPNPSAGGLRTWKAASLIVVVCTVAAFGSLAPVYTSAKVGNMGYGNETVLKCVVDWSEETEEKFTYALFVVGYCIPLGLIAYFYCRIVLKLRKRTELLHSETLTHRMRSVTNRSFALVAFYFVCWTPLWTMTLYISTYPVPSDLVIILYYFVHALVYVNSAMNPIFYVFIKSEVNNQRSRIQSPLYEEMHLRSQLLQSATVSTNV